MCRTRSPEMHTNHALVERELGLQTRVVDCLHGRHWCFTKFSSASINLVLCGITKSRGLQNNSVFERKTIESVSAEKFEDVVPSTAHHVEEFFIAEPTGHG